MTLLHSGSARTAFAVALALALGVTPSKAAEHDGPGQEASRHFHRGVELSEDGDWRAALIEFERAYAITPNFRVLYDIGQCRFQLHDYPGALTAFQKYLADGLELVPADRRATVVSDIESLKGRVAFVRLVTPETGAEISIDDTVVGTTPFASPVTVSAGRHKVSASKSGFAGVVRYVDVAGEETLDVPIHFGAPTATAAGAAVSSPARGRSLAPAFVAFGVAVVGAGVGSYLGIVAIQNKHDLAGTCIADSCPASSKPLYDDAQRNALWSTVGFGAAIVGAGVGAAYLVFTRPHESKPSPASAELRIVVGPGSIGVAGTF